MTNIIDKINSPNGELYKIKLSKKHPMLYLNGGDEQVTSTFPE